MLGPGGQRRQFDKTNSAPPDLRSGWPAYFNAFDQILDPVRPHSDDYNGEAITRQILLVLHSLRVVGWTVVSTRR